MKIIRIASMGDRGAARGRARVKTPTERCHLSNKLKFDSREHAEGQAIEWAHQNSGEYSTYECACGSWHLTRRVISFGGADTPRHPR